jgi:hypothetical protein
MSNELYMFSMSSDGQVSYIVLMGLEILEQLEDTAKLEGWASELERRSVLPPRLI